MFLFFSRTLLHLSLIQNSQHVVHILPQSALRIVFAAFLCTFVRVMGKDGGSPSSNLRAMVISSHVLCQTVKHVSLHAKHVSKVGFLSCNFTSSGFFVASSSLIFLNEIEVISNTIFIVFAPSSLRLERKALVFVARQIVIRKFNTGTFEVSAIIIWFTTCSNPINNCNFLNYFLLKLTSLTNSVLTKYFDKFVNYFVP